MLLKKKTQKTLITRLLLSCIILLFFALTSGAANPGDFNNSCVDCHMTLSPFTDEQNRLNEIRMNHTVKNISCSFECHAEEMEHFKNTMHYQRLKAESRAPSCVTCHRPHTFKVLKASEMTALCSVCHNPRDQIATASVPIDARNALEKQKEFQDELLIAKKSIASDKAARKDVTRAQIDMDKAQAVMDDIPSLWHQFNLKDFDNQIQNGIDWAKNAESKTSLQEPTVPKTPGFGIIMVFAVFAVFFLIRKR